MPSGCCSKGYRSSSRVVIEDLLIIVIGCSSSSYRL